MPIADKRVARATVIDEIRRFFSQSGFIETDTPSLVLSPGMETHIRPIQIKESSAYLPTSPEFAMKQLLAQGYPKIFQISKAYRNEPKSSTHNPEFAMIEWYRANSGYEAIMDDVEAMFTAVAQRVYKGTKFKTAAYGEQDLAGPWLRLTIEECFRRFAQIELTEHFDASRLARVCVDRGWAGNEVLKTAVLEAPGAWDDLFFRVMLNCIEPGLEKLGRPVIIYQYPESQAALSNVFTDSRGFRWAKRFEVYAGGLELGNAFDELVNPVEQRKRFEKDMQLREKLYGKDFPANPIDEGFLASLSKMPPSGGIAMGVDRIVMYFTGATEISEVLWLPSHWSNQ